MIYLFYCWVYQVFLAAGSLSLVWGGRGAALWLRCADVVWASAVAAHGLENLDSVVQGMDLVALWDVGCGVWDLPKPGVEPALAGGFLTTGHQGSPFLQCKRAQDYDSGGSLADFLLLRKDSLVELHVLSPLATIICLHGSPGVFLKSFHPIKRGSLHEQN